MPIRVVYNRHFLFQCIKCGLEKHYRYEDVEYDMMLPTREHEEKMVPIEYVLVREEILVDD